VTTADRSDPPTAWATVPAYSLRVNGEERTVPESWVGESLLYVLRERLGLFGAKNACEQGECGSCTVVVDGRLVCACLELASACEGTEVRTVESIGSDELLDDVQAALLATGGVQCGFCTPGFVVTIRDLLDRTSAPTDLELREALAGNLCRCTGYGRIFEAVASVVEVRRGRP